MESNNKGPKKTYKLLNSAGAYIGSQKGEATITAFAYRIGMDRAGLSKILNGTKDSVSDATLRRLTTKLGLEINKLVDQGTVELLKGYWDDLLRAADDQKNLHDKAPLSWSARVALTGLTDEPSCIFINFRGDERFFLPQLLIENSHTKSTKTVSLIDGKFDPPYYAERGVEFYKSAAKKYGKKLYESETSVPLRIGEWGENKVVVQSCPYFKYLGSNLSLDIPENNFRKCLTHKGTFDFEAAKNLGNVIGVNTLLFSSDRQLVLQRRSSEVLFRNDELCSASSGTAELKDTRGKKTFENILTVAALREKDEEIYDKPFKTIYLGGTRELIRGGAPEFFFAAWSRKTFAQIIEDSKDSKDWSEHAGRLFAVDGNKNEIFSNNYKPGKKDVPRTKLKGIVEAIKASTKGTCKISWPLLTNIILYVWLYFPGLIQTGKPTKDFKILGEGVDDSYADPEAIIKLV